MRGLALARASFILLLSLSACTIRPTTPPGMKVIDRPAEHFQLAVPSSWQLERPSRADIKIFATDPQTATTAYLIVEPTRFRYQTMPQLERYVRNYERYDPKGLLSAGPVGSELLPAGPAVYFSAYRRTAGQTFLDQERFLLFGGHLYQLSVLIPQASVTQERKDLVERVLQTMRFTT